MNEDLPWSDRIRLDQIGNGLRRSLEADDAARGRIAKALDLESLGRLVSTVEVKPQGRGWRLMGSLEASVVQLCGVTLEPLPAEVRNDFSVDLIEAAYAPKTSSESEEEIVDPDGPDVVEDGGIDLAVYVVEHLFLALDPYPRKPGAVFEPPAAETEPSPFDVLKSLKPDA